MKRHATGVTALLAAVLVVSLAMAACSTHTNRSVGALAGGQPSAAASAGSASSGPDGAGISPTPASPTGNPTAKPKPTATPKPTTTLAPPPAAPKITSVGLVANGATYTGSTCPHQFGFTGTIAVSAGPVTVHYAWTDSNGRTMLGALLFPAGGAQHKTIPYSINVTAPSLDTSNHGWAKLTTSGPNTMSTPNSTVVVTCEPALSALTVNAAGPGACTGVATPISFRILAPFAPATVPFTIAWGDSENSPGSHVFSGSGAQGYIYTGHHTYAFSGTYTITISTSLGNASISKTFTCS